MLVYSDDQLSGDVGGRRIRAKTMPPAQGAALPQGVFLLQAPDADPVFGPHVKALRTAGAPQSAAFPKMSQAASVEVMKRTAAASDILKKPAGATSRMVEWKLPATGGSSSATAWKVDKPNTAAGWKILNPDVAAGWKILNPGAAGGWKLAGRSAGEPNVFVISPRAIPGRYCLVVVSGFSDLVDALQGAGSAPLTVA